MEVKSFLQLKKNCKRVNIDSPCYKFAILGNCATQHLATAIKGYAYEEGYGFDIFDADYNQIDVQVMDKQSELYLFNPNAVLIYMCSEKLYEMFCDIPIETRASFAEMVCDKIGTYWELINQNIKTSILQFNFVISDDRVFGNYSLKTEVSFSYQLQKLNYLLVNKAQLNKNVYLIDLEGIQATMGRRTFFDEKLYYIAKMPIAIDSLPSVAKSVLDLINALNGRIKKCVVLDLDHTLWGGVIGDDGMNGIQIGELGIGHAYTEFQRWLKELKNRGIILSVCSKNNEDTAKEPFIHHPEMILRLEDFSIFVANWDNKANNIRLIQETLNIGMDSIVFIDDNPFERNCVKSMIPEVTVPELPEDPALYLSYIKSLNLFETTSYSKEDTDRTELYHAEADRIALQQQSMSIDDYLRGLDMMATTAAFDKFHYSRIAQLTQRSNQFNLRTIRYTEAEIEAIAGNENYITLYVCLRDKFGDHGLISVVIMDKPTLHQDQDKDTLFISEWLMSCRVLKRGMEEFIINKMIEIAKVQGYSKLKGEYIMTPKNTMVKDIYTKAGFVDHGNGIFVAEINNFKPKNTYIKETK